MADQKDTIYIDIDDEITAIIEKVRASEQRIVALVLPKRASVLQSIVNMKLLKRSADNAKKSLVLITSEAGLLPLAGTVGLYVARNLQTKPAIPITGLITDDEDTVDEADGPDGVEFDPLTVANQSVGDLAVSSSVPLVGAAAASSDAIETLELDDDAATSTDDTADKAAKPAKQSKVKKPKKDKYLAVPNFESFRKKLFLGVPLLIILIVGLVVAATALPKAEITIVTDTSSVNSNLAVSIDTNLKTANLDKKALPASQQKVDKAGSQQVATTGKKNNGNKASGSVALIDCADNDVTVPAGTGFTSGGNTFISQADVTVPASSFRHGSCQSDESANVQVTAQTGGAAANVGANSKFSVAGFSGLTASGSTAGGTDNIVQTVAQADIDSATQKITAQNSDAVKQQLEQQFKTAGLFALTATFAAGTPATTTSSKVGDEASTVSVSQTTSYTMFGIKEADLKALVDSDIKDKIDPSKQSILSEGLDKASFKVNSASPIGAQLAISTVATAGPDLKADQLKTQLAGMKKGEITDTLKADPGVSDVQVKLSPFWVTKVPKKANKVTISFQKAS